MTTSLESTVARNIEYIQVIHFAQVRVPAATLCDISRYLHYMPAIILSTACCKLP